MFAITVCRLLGIMLLSVRGPPQCSCSAVRFIAYVKQSPDCTLTNLWPGPARLCRVLLADCLLVRQRQRDRLPRLSHGFVTGCAGAGQTCVDTDSRAPGTIGGARILASRPSDTPQHHLGLCRPCPEMRFYGTWPLPSPPLSILAWLFLSPGGPRAVHHHITLAGPDLRCCWLLSAACIRIFSACRGGRRRDCMATIRT